MNRLRALSLRAKLNLGLLGLLVVVGLATAALLLLGLHRTQDNATETSRAGLEEQSQETLSVISEVQSTVGELQLNATAELGVTAAHYLSDAQYVPQAPQTDPERLAARGPVVFDPVVGRPTDIWYRGPLPLTGQAAEDLALSSPLDTLFRTLVNSQGLIREENFEAVAIYYIGPSGLLRYFPVVGLQDRLDPGFDILADQRYQLATPENDPTRETVWTAPYKNPAGQDLLLTAITPVYIDDEFRGVIGVDLSLARLIDQVDLIKVGASGFAFYVDSSGAILPSRSSAPINAALARDGNGQLRATIENMRQGLSGTDRIELGGREVFISYAPVAGPGGSLAVVAPVDEVTAAASDVTSSIESEGNRTIGATLLTMIVLFVATLFATAWLNRRVLIGPIEALVAGTDAVARGDLETKIPVRSDDELGLLARSFNRMTEQLQSSRQELEASGARFRGIFEATTDGVIINDPEIDGIALANPAAYRMFGYEPGELDRVNPRQLLGEPDESFFDHYARAMEEGRPYNGVTTGRRKDGSTFAMAVSGSPIEFGGREHHFAIVRDITEEVRAYELLEERVEERTRELSTLLRVSQSVGSTLDIDALLELILTQLHDVIEYSSASVLIREGDELRIVMSKGGVQPEALRTDIPLRIRIQEAGPIWEPLQRGEGVIIDDVRGDSPLALALQQAVGDVTAPGFEHIRSWMAVPFLAKGETVGFLAVARREPGSFEQRHAELATAFAGQAASALENAHLFAEADRRARENAALAAIAALFTLDQPLRTTLDALARSVCEATTAAASSVILLDEGQPSGFGGWGLPPGYMDTVARCLDRGAPWPALEAVVAGQPRFLEHGRTETLNEEAWADLHPFLAAVPWEGMYFLPIMYRGRAVGSLATYYSPLTPPSAEERSFLQAISDQAAVGLENRTLFSQAKRRIRENQALAEIAARFTLEEPLEKTLDGVAASVRAATSAVASSVMLVEDGKVIAAAGDGLPDHYMEMITRLAPDPSNSILLASASTAATVRVPDVRTHMLMEEKWAPMHDLLRDLEWEGVVATPLIYRGRVVGSIGTYYPPGQMPSESELAFLQALCDQAAIGVANGRLFAQSERRVRELDALTRVATQITVDQPLQETLDELAESVVSASRAVACSVTLFDEHGQFEGAGVANIPRDFPAAIAAAVSLGAPSTAAAAIRSMKPRVLPDARSLLLTNPAFASVRGFVEDAAWEAVIVTPLVLRGEVLGTLDTYYAPDDAPDAQETALLSAIANQASVAVDNARLFTQTEQRVRELEALARVASSLTVAQPMEETLGFLAETVVRSGDAIACSVVLIDPETEELRFAAQRGLPDGYVEAMNLSWRRGVPSETLIAFRTGDPQVIRNARDVVRTNPAYEAIWPYLDQIEWDNVAIVPLSYQGNALGALNCYFPPDKVPGDGDINLLRAIADQASAAVQNARLFAETRERARQLDALYRADEELHRSLELDNVLQAIVDVAVEFLGTDGASLVVWDEESDKPHVKLAGQALVAGEEAVLQGLEGHSREEFEGATFRVATDISSEPDLDAQRAATLGVGSFVQVPVVVNGRVFGIFDAAYRRPRAIPADEQRLFMALAQRAAIAIENAQLFAAGAERTRQLDALYRADEALHRSLRLDDVLQALNDVAVELLGADRSMLLSWRADEEYPVIRGASGVDPQMYAALEKSFREHSTRAGFSHREPLVIRDARTDPRAYPERVEIARIKSLIQLPIVVNDEVFGVFFIGWERPQAVTRHDERLFAALAQRAAVAIENAQLYEQAQNLAVVEERNRLARELHDSVSQALYGINLFARTARTLIEREPAKAVEPIDLVLTQAEAGLAEMRALIFALRPESLATEGIVRAIEKHAASARGRYQVQVDLDLSEEPDVPLPLKEALYRIMQEALHNIGKHANASRISIRLEDSPEGVTLDIQDDGAGFNPDEDFPGHLGLTSMKERAARLGGRLTIESAPGEGTHVSAWMPRPAPAA